MPSHSPKAVGDYAAAATMLCRKALNTLGAALQRYMESYRVVLRKKYCQYASVDPCEKRGCECMTCQHATFPFERPADVAVLTRSDRRIEED
jgi:hypothetical protein